MNRAADRTSRPAGPRPVGTPLGPLDYDAVDDTAPSTPYPGRRFAAVRRWLGKVRSWVSGPKSEQSEKK